MRALAATMILVLLAVVPMAGAQSSEEPYLRVDWPTNQLAVVPNETTLLEVTVYAVVNCQAGYAPNDLVLYADATEFPTVHGPVWRIEPPEYAFGWNEISSGIPLIGAESAYLVDEVVAVDVVGGDAAPSSGRANVTWLAGTELDPPCDSRGDGFVLDGLRTIILTWEAQAEVVETAPLTGRASPGPGWFPVALALAAVLVAARRSRSS
jgi:hypothetical protein